MSRCDHETAPGRKEGSERCKKCSWTFPCREQTCAHMDCLEFRKELPKCYYCGKRVEGNPGGVCSPSSAFTPIAKSDRDASWMPWNVRGHTRAVHYTCREANASP